MRERTAKVLIIDELDLWRNRLRAFIETWLDVEVVEASTMEEVIEQLGQEPPAVVLLDLSLAGGGSRRVAGWIRDAWPQVPVIALCTYDWPEYREAAQRIGAVAFVPKERVVAELPPALRASLRLESEQPHRERFTDLFTRVVQSLVPQVATAAAEFHWAYQHATMRQRQRIWALLFANYAAVQLVTSSLRG